MKKAIILLIFLASLPALAQTTTTTSMTTTTTLAPREAKIRPTQIQGFESVGLGHIIYSGGKFQVGSSIAIDTQVRDNSLGIYRKPLQRISTIGA